MHKSSDGRRRKRRIAGYTLLAMLVLSVALPLGGYIVHGLMPEVAAQEPTDTNPRSNYWRAVREGVEGTTTVDFKGSEILIQAGGSEWTNLRNGPVADYVPWAIVGMAVLILLFHLFVGRNRLDGKPLSGRRVPRWSAFERAVHWTVAISFIVLAVTGLSMLVGRALLIPVLGKAGFATWAQASISIHNFVGPVFSVGILLMIVMWIWHNIPAKHDLTWLKMGGGMVGDAHPPAGRMNAGEKIWFWLMATLGVAVALSGLFLVAPIYGLEFVWIVEAGRPGVWWANMIHAVGSLIWSAIALGHIYIGTAGTEGAFEGMARGHVSEEWAKQHHDIWYEEMAGKGRVFHADDDAGSAASGRGDAATAT